MELTRHAATFDRAAPTYDRVGVDFFAVFGRQLVELAALRPGEAVLDVGCGRGAVLDPASAAVGPTGRAVGIDLAPTMVALTAADLGDRPQVVVQQADAATLPADLGPFDAVLSSLVLFFTDDPAAALAHWAGFVAPGGRLGLVTFLPDPDDDWFRDLLRRRLPDPPPRPDGPDAFALTRDPVWLDGALADAGLRTRTADVRRHAVRFTDADRWWAWVWSHGGRAPLEQLTDADRDAVRAEGAAALHDRPLPDGTLGLHVTVRLTLADRG